MPPHHTYCLCPLLLPSSVQRDGTTSILTWMGALSLAAHPLEAARHGHCPAYSSARSSSKSQLKSARPLAAQWGIPTTENRRRAARPALFERARRSANGIVLATARA